MTPRLRRRETQLAFETLSIEGGLLSPEWLSRVAQLTAGQQAEADYRAPKGLTLRDEIGRYWRIAQAHWKEFAAGRAKLETKPDQAAARALAVLFVESLLRECFGFGSLATADPVIIDGRSYPIGLAALDGRVPVVIAPAGAGLDAPFPFFGDGGRRRTAFGLTQEYLNAADEATWGLASDGLTLRVLRDNASMTRPAWIEADVARVFVEERYADFAALWLVVHETRFGRASPREEGEAPAECALDLWRAAGREEGTRARDELRRGFEEALLALGQGFLAQADNGALRAALQGGTLSREAYFHQLLRLVYRFIFLLTAEERGLLHPPGADEAGKELYSSGYSLRRLRDRSARRSAHDRFPDLWQATKIVFGGLGDGEPRLGLPALAGLFAATQCPDLDAAKLENRALLLAVFRLSWLKEKSGLVRVNWRDMGPEELGSVYESLLELQPQITDDGRGFAFATGDETKGHARKKTGSYYTPDSLVQVLLDSALEPVVQNAIASNPQDPVGTLLRLAIVDPACGSGHFLLAAARRLAAHVARLQADGTPSAAEYRSALRLVVSRCIHGVDLNPMAVELCKVSLWMEAVEPGLPLTFLDSHIQHGNALLGTTPELMANGIPDAAWEPIEGDDKKVAAALKKRNKAEAAGQRGLHSVWTEPANDEATKVARAFDELESAADLDPAALTRKESQWRNILASDAYRHQRFIGDAWCAAFVWPKQLGSVADAAPTIGRWTQIRDGAGKIPPETMEGTNALRDQYRFFHWYLAFPSVFARGGFDVVLGNPPWERVKLQEQEFFASRSDEIANAPNAAARKKLIAKLAEVDPLLWSQWCAATREASGQSHFVRQSGRFPLCGQGDINTYALFAEHNRALLGPAGRAGFIVPSGLVTDDSTKDYFQALVATNSLAAVYHFENEDKLFPEVHHAYRFVLMAITHAGAASEAMLLFYARSVDELALADRRFTLSASDFETLNPNTKTCPTFRSRRDAEINLAIYRRLDILLNDATSRNPWQLRVRTRLWHMAEDSEWFKTRSELEADGYELIGNRFRKSDSWMEPLYEAKMIHQFDHRYGTYEGQTEAQANQGKLPELSEGAHRDPSQLVLSEYWVPREQVEERLNELWPRGWLLGWRDITGSEKQRTVIVTLLPRVATANTAPLLFPGVAPRLVAALYANLCSFVFDYTARQKVGGTHLTFNYLKQLPVLAPDSYERNAPFAANCSVGDWLLPLVAELTYTAWDLQPFARDIGYEGPPFRWEAERRFQLRAQLDAAFFHLYALSRDQTSYVLDTFPIVRKNDVNDHGDYRTKRVILQIYDEMAEAIRVGRPYQTRLDPPPADPRVAHAVSEVVAALPVIPLEIPMLPADQAAVFLIWALLRANGGSIRRADLARAFALRSRPELMARHAPPSFGPSVSAWRRMVSNQGTAPPLMVETLRALVHRQGVDVGLDAESRSVVRVSAHTPSQEQIADWYRFEAALVLGTLRQLPAASMTAVDAGMTQSERALLEDVS